MLHECTCIYTCKFLDKRVKPGKKNDYLQIRTVTNSWRWFVHPMLVCSSQVLILHCHTRRATTMFYCHGNTVLNHFYLITRGILILRWPGKSDKLRRLIVQLSPQFVEQSLRGIDQISYLSFAAVMDRKVSHYTSQIWLYTHTVIQGTNKHVE